MTSCMGSKTTSTSYREHTCRCPQSVSGPLTITLELRFGSDKGSVLTGLLRTTIPT